MSRWQVLIKDEPMPKEGKCGRITEIEIHLPFVTFCMYSDTRQNAREYHVWQANGMLKLHRWDTHMKLLCRRACEY